MTFPLAASIMTVPSGTFRTISAPFPPWHLRFPPGSPSVAENFFCGGNQPVYSVLRQLQNNVSALPPSPPSGPPFGTKSSLRKLTCPSPPLPERIRILLCLQTWYSPVLFYLNPNRSAGPLIIINKNASNLLRFEAAPLSYSSVATGYTETCFLSRPFLSKATRPSTIANKVSSFPIPTFTPG